jgi:RHS repeat-associated protein
VQQGGATFVYDGDGNRVQKTVAGNLTLYFVDNVNPTGNAQVLAEETASTFVLTGYIWGLDLITRGTFSGSPVYYVHDGHGSVRVLTDPNGTVTDTYDYDAFGNLIHQTGTTANNYLFADEQFDPNLNLYYNRARYLSTNTGRFWTMDTFEGDPQSPQSLHKYLYVSDDPINRRDQSGNIGIDELAVGLAVASIAVNTAFLIFHLHRAFTANSPQEKVIETTLVYTDTLGIFLAFVGGGFIGPTASLASGGVATVASVSTTAIYGSLVIPGAANIVYFSGTSASGGGSSGSSGSGSIDAKDDHVDVPKHNLNQLAPTYAEQKQLLIDAVRKITSANKGTSNVDGDAFEDTMEIINSNGKPVTTTIRWFRYSDGTQRISTAFVPPATP